MKKIALDSMRPSPVGNGQTGLQVWSDRLMDLLTILGYTVGGLAFVALLAIWLTAANRRAKRILRTGGPHSISDFLHLFPEACTECGSRDLVEISEIYTAQTHGPSYDMGGGIGYGVVVQKTVCSHGHVLRKTVDKSDPGDHIVELNSITEKNRRVYSPYMDREVADQIPEWPTGKR
jgi:hypothetical protein